jgi:hypothetical protein
LSIFKKFFTTLLVVVGTGTCLRYGTECFLNFYFYLFSDGQKAQLLKEMSGLNLTKYVGELASALLEAKLKMSDVTAAVEFCSEVHQKVKLIVDWIL